MRLYLAAPLFSAAERAFNLELALALRRRGHEVFLPQETEFNSERSSSRAIFEGDMTGLRWCDAVVACLDGPDPDSGTCWECGWAYERRPVVVFRTDVRIVRDGLAPFNIMLAEGSDALLIFEPKITYDEMAARIGVKLGGLVR